MKIVRVLLAMNRPCSLRELVDLTSISPGGAKDALSRLAEAKVVQVQRKGNKTFHSICSGLQDLDFLETLVKCHVRHNLKERADIYSRRSLRSISWIDENVTSLKQIKSKNEPY